MCGITGFYSRNNFFSEPDLHTMTKALVHRGPDAEGYFCQESIGLGHRRLSIIDLSENANQPMHSHNNQYVIVFNGEIYNFAELANELQLTPRTTSDTEVLLEAFVKWGVDFVKKLNGMFAIAIYCKTSQKLYLFRDRIGIKPLFYYLRNGQLAFASELKSLLKIGGISEQKQLNAKAVSAFLHLGYIPEPLTIYEHIYKFPKGSYAVFDGSELLINHYWQLNSQISKGVFVDAQDAKAQLNDLIKDSVRYRLIADVPFGTFLSGGVDSSLVSAVAQKTTNHQLKTFSIGFDDPKFNETKFSRQVAQHIESDHHEFILTEQDALKLVPDLFSYYDEPYADASAIPTMLVSKMAREYVVMTLSGDGGDELFHGYGMYNWAARLQNPLVEINRKLLAQVAKFGPSRIKRIGQLFNYQEGDSIKSHIFSQEQYFFAQHELNSLLKEPFVSNVVLNEDYSHLQRSLSSAEEQALFDLNYYLPDDLLVKVDRASMRYSLETRVPLLDHRIVEFALNLSPKLKVNNHGAKYLLKQVLYDYVPQEIFERPKWGFGIPLGRWLKKELKPMLDHYLNEPIIREAGFVNYEKVFDLKTRFLSGKEDYLYNRLWVLICLHKWHTDVFKT